AEREQVYSAQERLLYALRQHYKFASFGAGIRMLKLNSQADKAEALLLTPGYGKRLLALHLIRKDGTWFVNELRDEDLDFNTITEAIKPAILQIQAKRKGTTQPRILPSAESRIISARAQDAKLALQVADQALRENPTSKSLRFLKAVCLLESIQKADEAKTDEAIKILSSLADEQKDYVAVIKTLSDHYSSIDEDDPQARTKQEKAIEFLKRDSVLSPSDPRPHQKLAEIYDEREDAASAEREYRTVIELDPMDPQNYQSLARSLINQRRYKDALAVVDQTKGRGTTKDEVFSGLFLFYGDKETIEIIEGLAAESPDRMNANARANINLASIRISNDRAKEALPLLKRAIELDAKNTAPHTLSAEAYRKLHNWPAALKSADAALAIYDKNAEAYFHRACALAQLRRLQEAVASLKKCIELDDESYSSEDIEGEADLQPLVKLPAFKKLIEKLKSAEAAETDKD
ncbi:MAG TPA: tetratricopeptide repeat protein, partial [Blastocatellia bacterium]|nr:tetratricopeptide repeat protein [Blastocatellia bacterium]